MLAALPNSARLLLLGAGVAGLLVLLALLGFWSELLWYSAMDSTDRFWSFGPSRIAFACVGAVVVTGFSWPLITLFHTDTSAGPGRWFYAVLAVLSGVITGLGAWELFSMQAQSCSAGEFLEVLGMCNRRPF